jgi:Na+/proline symporter
VLGGLAAVVLIGHGVDGGWGAIFDAAGAADKLKTLDFTWNISQPHNVYAGLIGGAFLSMASHGADQLIVQRLLSSRTLKDGQAAIIGSGVVIIAQFALFLLIGVGLWVLDKGATFSSADAIFPTFIIDHMPHGLVGLLLAAVLAATMSTHSGAINSLAAASVHDIYLPLTGKSAQDPSVLGFSKTMALVWGVILTGGALLFPENPKLPIVVVALSIASFTQGGLLGGFFLGIFWRRAIQRDAILGMAVAIAVMAFIVFAKQLLPLSVTSVLAEPNGLKTVLDAAHAASPLHAAYLRTLVAMSRIAWPWYVLIGTAITMVVGILSSFTHAAPLRVATATP